MKPYWTRLRDNDNNFSVVLHEDWIIGECQLGYMSMKVSRQRTWTLMVRQKKGWFGCSKWYDVRRFEDFENLCINLNGIVEDSNEDHWIAWMELIDENNEKEKLDRLKKEYCGFDLDRRITRL